MRRRAALLLAAVVAIPAGCGGRFELPTEHPGRIIPTDQSYIIVDTWTGMGGVRDLLITQGQGNQLFVLFNHGGDTGPSVPRGEVKLFPLSNPHPIGQPYFFPLNTLFDPVAIASATNKLFVLDQGDSCQAKFDVRRHTCEADPDTTHATGHPFHSQIFSYAATWRVREYGLGGGDTLSTFTDTTVAQPFGIAADEQGRVYVACLAVFLDSLQTNKNIRTRKFVSRVFRYARGLRYPGVLDLNMPGTASWHRDSTWTVFDGSGLSSVSDPRGIFWARTGTNPLFIADRGNNSAKAVSSVLDTLPVLRVDGQETGASFNHPEAVAVDLAGFFYVVDRDNKRVLRFSESPAQFVQRVDTDKRTHPLADPVGIAVDDSTAYVADPGNGEIVRYKRQQ